MTVCGRYVSSLYENVDFQIQYIHQLMRNINEVIATEATDFLQFVVSLAFLLFNKQCKETLEALQATEHQFE